MLMCYSPLSYYTGLVFSNHIDKEEEYTMAQTHVTVNMVKHGMEMARIMYDYSAVMQTESDDKKNIE